MQHEDKDQSVYDPFAADLQMQAYEQLGPTIDDVEELCKPAVVKLLIQNHRVTLTQLKVSQESLKELEARNSQLQTDREELRVSQAGSRARDHYTWLEIPAAIGAGFAGNMVVGNVGAPAGWLLLAVTVVILFYIRAHRLGSPLTGRDVPSPRKGDTRE